MPITVADSPRAPGHPSLRRVAPDGQLRQLDAEPGRKPFDSEAAAKSKLDLAFHAKFEAVAAHVRVPELAAIAVDYAATHRGFPAPKSACWEPGSREAVQAFGQINRFVELAARGDAVHAALVVSYGDSRKSVEVHQIEVDESIVVVEIPAAKAVQFGLVTEQDAGEQNTVLLEYSHDDMVPAIEFAASSENLRYIRKGVNLPGQRIEKF